MKRYIITFLLFIIAILIIYTCKDNYEVPDAKQVFSVAELKSNCDICKISDDTDKYSISIYYPNTEYEELNKAINDIINKYIEDFKKDVDGLEQKDYKYKLDISFNSYEYMDYISYVFNVFTDVGGAHPNTVIFSISFNTLTKKVMKIMDLMDMNKDLLNILSKYSYEKLKEEPKIKQYGSEEMLKSGTEPKVENFNTFAFSKEGLKLFFENYSVAPYVAGEFVLTIPYDKLGLNL